MISICKRTMYVRRHFRPWGHAPAQERAWPVIKQGKHTLIAAPTGSGKTLAAFLSAIDDLVREGLQGTDLKGSGNPPGN